MSNPNAGAVSVTVNPTFWELFVASLTMIRYRGLVMIFHAIFPMFGLFIIVDSLYKGYRFGPAEVALILGTLFFTPYVTALAVWVARRRNKLAQGPFTHSFDAEGVSTRGAALERIIKWPGVFQVRQSKRFLFIFISPSMAIVIPVKSLHDQGVYEEVRSLARQHSDFR